MSTHLLSFLLLTKHRNGVSLEQMVQDVEWLRTILCKDKKINLTYQGNLENFVEQGLKFLGSDTVQTERMSVKWSVWSGANAGPGPVNKTVESYRTKPRYKLCKNNTWQLIEMTSSDEDEDDQSFGDSKQTSLDKLDKSRLEIVHIRPLLNLTGALDLHYYANTCVFLFRLESILGN